MLVILVAAIAHKWLDATKSQVPMDLVSGVQYNTRFALHVLSPRVLISLKVSCPQIRLNQVDVPEAVMSCETIHHHLNFQKGHSQPSITTQGATLGLDV